MTDWWYADGDKRAGPVEEAELRRLFQTARIGLASLVWREGMPTWKPFGDIDELKSLTAAVPPPLPSQPVPPPLTANADIDQRSYPLTRAWPRFFARIFDVWWETMFVGFVMGIVLVLMGRGAWLEQAPWSEGLLSMIVHAIINPKIATIASAGLMLLCLPMALLFDACLFSIAGNTPGKSMLGLRVLTADGQQLRFGQHLKRNLSMWVSGMGMGIPIVNLLNMDAQRRRVQRGQPATYDQSEDFAVRSKPVGMGRKVVFATAFVAILGVNIAFREAQRTARSQRLSAITYSIPHSESIYAIRDTSHGSDDDPHARALGYVRRGKAAMNDQDYDRAFSEFNEAIRVDAHCAEAFGCRGGVWLKRYRPEEAMPDYNEAIRLDPTVSAAYTGRGRARLGTRDIQNALRDYNTAISLDRGNAEAYAGRGDCWSLLQQDDTALDDYRQAIRLDPKNDYYYCCCGRAWESKGDYRNAISDYEQAIQMEPKMTSAYGSLASLLTLCPDARFRDAKRAVRLATKACELWNWSGYFDLQTLATACGQARQFDDAVRYQRMAIDEYRRLGSQEPSDIIETAMRHQLESYEQGRLP